MKLFRYKQFFYERTLTSFYALSIVAFIVVLPGCSTVGYYSQIVSGHMRIVMGKRPVAEVVSDENINDAVKRRLDVAQRAREFAIEELRLPNNESYTSFYDTGKRFVTWNVVAADEFSFEPKIWCFPVAGCIAYRGYYAEEDAQSYADALDVEGLDVAINGATAYSTLGWFKDPLLNTMLDRSDPGIASLLFHELAHQQLYVGDDSTFNESFASFVEREGLKYWEEYEAEHNPHPDSDKISAELQARKKRRQEFVSLLSDTRDALNVVYESDIDEDTMRKRKQAGFEKMLADYQVLKQSWDNYEGYDRWFSSELNNARLVSVSTYNDYIPAFKVMFDQAGGSFAKFYQEAQRTADLPAEERTQLMEDLLSQASVPSQ